MIYDAPSARYRCMISFRFAEAHQQSIELQAVLNAHGFSTFLSGTDSAGTDLQTTILRALDECDLVLIMGSMINVVQRAQAAEASGVASVGRVISGAAPAA